MNRPLTFLCTVLTAVFCFLPQPVESAPIVLSHLLKNEQPDLGQVPGRRSGGAGRGECPMVNTPLLALAPAIVVESEGLPITYVGGVTTAEYPTLWFYVPYTLNAELTADFIVQDEQGQEVYTLSSSAFPPSEVTPGLVQVSLPSSLPPLETGQVYHWYFKVNCDAESLVYTEGGIERVPLEPTLIRQLAMASPLEQAAYYRDARADYEAIAILATLYRDNPTDEAIAQAWTHLLQSLGIELNLQPVSQ